jgi:hypothetical protein
MTDRPASWRMPNAKQMERMAAALDRKPLPTPAPAPNDDLPTEYWQALLEDACTGAMTSKSCIAVLRLAEIPRDLLRVSCRHGSRTVEIEKVEARLYGQRAVWKDVAWRLLDDTCTQRTGRHEEDGCWPLYDAP